MSKTFIALLGIASVCGLICLAQGNLRGTLAFSGITIVFWVIGKTKDKS